MQCLVPEGCNYDTTVETSGLRGRSSTPKKRSSSFLQNVGEHLTDYLYVVSQPTEVIVQYQILVIELLLLYCTICRIQLMTVYFGIKMLLCINILFEVGYYY